MGKMKEFLGDVSCNDAIVIHDLAVLSQLCVDHNDDFTKEEKAVLGKAIGMFIGIIEDDDMREALEQHVVNICRESR